MNSPVYIERHKRGFFGWIFLIIFILWNLFMLSWAVATMGLAGGAGATGLALFLLLFIWAIGSVVTGLLVLVTRGSKTIVKKQ